MVPCASGRRPDRYRRPPAAPPPPLPSSRRDLPRALVPSRVVLAFVPGIALQVPAAAAGPRSGARRRPLWPARPLPCTLGSACAPAASWAPVTHWTDHPQPAPLSGYQACIDVPETCAAATIAIHRIPPTDCALE
ncbi:PREDICTED: CAAX box protein 1-like [Ceratotherium simum simum]|uniref:CAAX box protein 1-like n=1 Tax=Ceratotherium simum simum TaxID=73337 RepID=A0ABM1C705_CERSS|nr:PREDICTED: CAAX box protein 1-like [Ceratotherium simum simum]